MTDSSREKVRDFLQEVKDVITSPAGDWRQWVIVRREKNLEFIAELGFNFADIRNILLDLSVADYCAGPVDDRDEGGYVWIFGKEIGSRETYIKLKLASFGSLKVVRVVSFHRADKPLDYVYRENGSSN